MELCYCIICASRSCFIFILYKFDLYDGKVETHVISSISHIAHEYDDDNEPWPLQIEDHDGNLHSISLEPGQVFIVCILFNFDCHCKIET